ncbi:MAG: hypothetical protein QOF81_2561 [Acidimicrobiaceae bacterium]|nr:hypothetical protein [Acidimicrobiaceae bacterium]
MDSYAVFWLAGIGFLWWPAIMLLTLWDRRVHHRRPIALWLTTSSLAASLLVAVALQASFSRLLGAVANLSVWITVCAVLARRDEDLDVGGVIRGVIDLAAFQGVLVIVARLGYPAFSGTRLPLARLLPASLADDANVAAFSTVRLAFLDYYNKVVIRTGGIFGTPTWAGALAAIAILLLLFAGDSLGPFIRRPVVRLPLVALFGTTLFLSYARVDVVALALAAGAIIAMKARRVVHPSLWLATVFLAIGAVFAVLPVLPLHAWFADVNNARQGSLVARGDIYTPTLKAILKAPTPVLGSGIKPRVNGLVASLGTHGTYLGLAYRGGLVCAASFLVFLMALAARSLDRDAELAFGLACFLLIWCLTDDIDAGNLMPLVIVIAYGSMLVRSGRRKDRAPSALEAPS